MSTSRNSSGVGPLRSPRNGLETPRPSRLTIDDITGIVMMIDTASKPTGGYYVLDKKEDNSLSIRLAMLGPMLLTSSRHSFLPQAYGDAKVLIQLSCIEGYQSAPRSVWNMAMQLGFAESRYTGQCFQGMSSHDVSSFV